MGKYIVVSDISVTERVCMCVCIHFTLSPRIAFQRRLPLLSISYTFNIQINICNSYVLQWPTVSYLVPALPYVKLGYLSH